jgi:hypothetical protein
MLSLPTTASPLRQMFDVQSLVDWRTLPTFRQGLEGCTRFLQSEPAAKSAQSVVMRADGEIWLIRVGPKGGWKKLWNFGNPIAA